MINSDEINKQWTCEKAPPFLYYKQMILSGGAPLILLEAENLKW